MGGGGGGGEINYYFEYYNVLSIRIFIKNPYPVKISILCLNVFFMIFNAFLL